MVLIGVCMIHGIAVMCKSQTAGVHVVRRKMFNVYTQTDARVPRVCERLPPYCWCCLSLPVVEAIIKLIFKKKPESEKEEASAGNH